MKIIQFETRRHQDTKAIRKTFRKILISHVASSLQPNCLTSADFKRRHVTFPKKIETDSQGVVKKSYANYNSTGEFFCIHLC